MRPSDGDDVGTLSRWITWVGIGIQMILGVVCGWVSGILAFLALLACLRRLGVGPAARDLLAGGGLIVGTLVAMFGAAVAFRRYRRAWLPFAIGVATGLMFLTAFVVAVAIPFGAGMRNFD